MQKVAAVVPQYLQDTYWWAYVHPNAVRIFERQWLVNLILWGNFARLRDAALTALGPAFGGRSLQVACVYGNFTQSLVARLPAGASLDVADVLPIQLDNLRRKLGPSGAVRLLHQDASALTLATGSYERVVLFFLLHEVPEDVRRAALAQAVRVLVPGGRLVIVDYHRPNRWHPLRAVMTAILRRFEPFAMELWARPLATWLPPEAAIESHCTYCGGLYQRLVIRKNSAPD